MMGENNNHWLTPPLATLMVGVATLGITGLVALTYTPLRNGLDELHREVAAMKADPSPKPETKVELEAIDEKIADLNRRVDRLDERLANLHMYLMQVVPPQRPTIIPPSRRGDIPAFRPRL